MSHLFKKKLHLDFCLLSAYSPLRDSGTAIWRTVAFSLKGAILSPLLGYWTTIHWSVIRHGLISSGQVVIHLRGKVNNLIWEKAQAYILIFVWCSVLNADESKTASYYLSGTGNVFGSCLTRMLTVDQSYFSKACDCHLRIICLFVVHIMINISVFYKYKLENAS